MALKVVLLPHILAVLGNVCGAEMTLEKIENNKQPNNNGILSAVIATLQDTIRSIG